MGSNYLLIGASSGIGEACARELASEDVTLVLVARREELLDKLAEELPGKVIPFVYDLHDLENIKRIFSVCKDNGFLFDGMVYSAGVDGIWPIKANNVAKMREMMDINCLAFAEVGRHFYSKRYTNEKASIVAISSIASILADKGMMAYAASKAALNSVVKTMANEFAGRHIRVNAILPAGVDTPMARAKREMMNGMSSEEESEAGTKQPWGIIPAENIAKQVEFLLSERAGYITGELLTVSGGMII